SWPSAAQNCATLCQVGVLSPAGRSNSASWKPTATIPPVRPISWPPKRACCVRALAIASRMRGSLTGLAAPFMQALACSDTCGPAASACMESAAATRNSAIDLILWSCANALASDPHRDSVARWRVRCVEHFSRADFKLADILLQSAIPFILMRCEDIASNTDFRHLSTIRDIVVDLRYASVDNFVGRDLYGLLDCAWLHHLAAAGLERAVALLDREAAGHRLLVLDALRPHRVQIQLWDHLAGTDLRQYVADPSLGSIHSFGMALDATLLDPQGRELDMGSGFDEMTELSHPQLEAKHLAAGELTPAQHRN